MAANSSGQALHSRDPLLIRTSGITLSSSISQPNRRQLCSMLMHIHLDTLSLKTLHLGTLFFLFYLALTQNEENICDGKVTL
ncbi:SOSS complex subunit C isoform X4 [Macaca thibetana thibetana]|uniref:SOSS complex subunit C isoform X4 n=1 Tax=Macaca thibetana thibetana TaxID=257877 RepID=UPI0021BC9BE2|nr:SOSS complex subunit C isoform X4 [Macaca thibetana thibetana]